MGKRRRQVVGTTGKKGQIGAKKTLIALGRDAFLAYYKEQRIAPDVEIDEMMRVFETPLPISFRVSGCDPMRTLTKSEIEFHSKSPGLQSLRVCDFYPQESCFEMSGVAAMHLKDPKYKSFREFLISENQRGGLTRQEIVSTLSPILLMNKINDTIEHHHQSKSDSRDDDCVVLDLCAAPGSKTSEILDLIFMRGSKVEDNYSGSFQYLSPEMRSAVVANDVNMDRAHMLSHQLNRLGFPNVAVTCCDGAFFPGSAIPYNYVLADVLCSGDGTLRKNFDIFEKWNALSGISLHSKQSQLLCRAITSTRGSDGAIIVYSTCSLNPIEDEAVVHSALKRFANEVELVKIDFGKLNLKVWNGINSWFVPNPDFLWKTFEFEVPEKFYTFAEFEIYKKQIIEKGLFDKSRAVKSVLASQFPPAADSGDSESHSQTLCLSNCVRVPPHLNDTGGFFLSVLRRIQTGKKARREVENEEYVTEPSTCDLPAEISEVNVKYEAEIDCSTDPAEGSEAGPKKRPKRAPVVNLAFWRQVSPFAVEKKNEIGKEEVDDDAKIMKSIFDFYGLKFIDENKNSKMSDEDFACARSPFMMKNGTDRRVYLVSPKLLKLVNSYASKNFKFMQVGVRAFEMLAPQMSANAPCVFRVVQEVGRALLPFMHRRIIHANTEIAEKLLIKKEVIMPQELSDFEQSGAVWNVDSCRKNGLIESGAGYLAVHFSNNKNETPMPLAILLNAKTTLTLQVSEMERSNIVKLLESYLSHSKEKYTIL